MANVNFFTAVSFGNQPKSCSQTLLEKVDGYFHLGGKKAYVIPGHTQQGVEGVLLTQDSPSLFIVVLRVLSYFTIIFPIVMLAVKAVLRSIHTFHIIDVRQKIEEGINLSQKNLEAIAKLMQESQEIIKYSGRNQVFSLKSMPELIFKRVAGPESRFANMIRAKEVCLAHQLSLLIIPHAKIIKIGDSTLIVEERFNIRQHDSAQEELYSVLSGLDETVRQLAIFIAKTGFSDVEWRNIPIVDDAPEFQGSRRVALVDLEEMESAETGLFGEWIRRGLIRCLSSERHIEIALAVARRYGIHDRYSTTAKVKAERINEVQSYQRLQQFYAEHGILKNARKPIQVDDLSSLGLNLEEQREQCTMRKAVAYVITCINEAIGNTPEDASVKGKRYIYLNTNRDLKLMTCEKLGLPEDGRLVTETDENQGWLRRIINALVAKGHLFKLDRVNGHGYFIQA